MWHYCIASTGKKEHMKSSDKSPLSDEQREDLKALGETIKSLGLDNRGR